MRSHRSDGYPQEQSWLERRRVPLTAQHQRIAPRRLIDLQHGHHIRPLNRTGSTPAEERMSTFAVTNPNREGVMTLAWAWAD